MRWTTLGAAVLVVGLGASPVRAQSGDEVAVMAVVEGMFDAMRAKDADALRALFTEDARLVSTGTDAEGRARVRVVPMADFAANVGNATAYLDEQIWDEEVRIHDNLATVWVKYALFVDQQFSHCGVDAFQLFKGAEGWKVFQIADTQRRQDCWMPPS